MTDNVDQIDQDLPEDAELLLPWYVSGRISDADRKKVDAWLSENPDARNHLNRASEEMDLTFADTEQLGRPSRQSFDELMARIEPQPNVVSSARGWVDRLWESLSPRYALAGAAALFMLVLGQGAVIGLLTSNPTAPSYEVAGAQNPLGPQRMALVSFVPGTALADITEALDQLDLRIVDGPAPGGIYTIAASDDEDGAAALKALSEESGLVAFFSETD